MKPRPEDNHPNRLYAELPVTVQANISPKEYAWLSNEQRQTLIEDFTEPSEVWVDS